MSKPLSSFYDATKYLGQFVGDQEPFLRMTSCMDEGNRETIALLQYLIERTEDKKRKEKLVRLQSVFSLLGFAHWQRDTVTDLALRKVTSTTTENFGEEDGVTASEPEEDSSHT